MASGNPRPGSSAIVHGTARDYVAEITRVRKDGLVDLTFINQYGQEQVITSSPRDDSGTKPDSWRPAPPTGEAATAPPAAAESSATAATAAASPAASPAASASTE